MIVVSNPMTVADYMPLVLSENIRVNKDYQRGGGIWSSRAKSALIETMVLGYPMPALFVHQTFDKIDRKPFRDVVDGQQRTEAIRQFWDGTLRLSKTVPTDRLKNRKMKDLDEDDYKALVTYSLPIFLFTDATELEVREAFRRINSHTSVLTPDERRHAVFQGEMKWFILDLGKELQAYFENWQVFNRKQLVRMADSRLLAEIVLAVLSGIKTVKSNHLDHLYKRYDDEGTIPAPEELKRDIVSACQQIDGWEWITGKPLVKPYHISLLILSVMHAGKAISALESIVDGGRGLKPVDDILGKLGELVDALEAAGEGSVEIDDEDEVEAEETAGSDLSAESELYITGYNQFVEASRAKTNTEGSRRARFITFYQAVAQSHS